MKMFLFGLGLVQPICISTNNDFEDQVVIEIGTETYARATFWKPNDCFDLIGTTECVQMQYVIVTLTIGMS